MNTPLTTNPGANPTTIALAPAARWLAQQEADRMLADTEGVTAVVVATVDGFDVASAVRGPLDPSRLAAMASSISAIAYVVTDEAQLGRGKRVTIETEAGFATVVSVPRADAELVVVVVTDGRTLLGEVAYRTAAMARLLQAA